MSKKPRIAIIGGGIFGASCARELAGSAEVVLFERNGELLAQATWANQYRHHYGYHYHQSEATALQCKETRADFEHVWGKAILHDFPSYYCVAKGAQKITLQQLKEFYRRHELPYTEEWPPEEFLNPDEIVGCIKTSEPVYDYPELRNIIREELNRLGVAVRLGSEVLEGKIEHGEKIFTIREGNAVYTDAFDYAINATYAYFNVFCGWFGFLQKALDFYLKELLFIRLPNTRPMGITVMDKFVTILPTDRRGGFSVGDVLKSVHDTKLSAYLPPWTAEDMRRLASHKEEMLAGNVQFVPILGMVTDSETRWSVMPRSASSSTQDDRLTTITAHGNGCFSVLSGKIISAVAAARKISYMITQEMTGAHTYAPGNHEIP